MRERLNVLSIDWDFFINASYSDRVCLFPECGEGYGTNINNIVWGNRYASDSRLKKIRIGLKDTRKVASCVFRNMETCDSSVMVVDSHKYAYDFVKEFYERSGGFYEGINLVNVDFHHDIYNMDRELSEVNCGNWLGKLILDFSDTASQYTWVKREDSDPIPADKRFAKVNCTDKLDILEEYDWDIIFICRSGMWSPPHLDDKFIQHFGDILDKATELGNFVEYQKDIFHNRFDDSFQEYIKGQKSLNALIERQWCGL